MIRHKISLRGKYRQFFIIYCIGGGFLAFALLIERFGAVAQLIIEGMMEDNFQFHPLIAFFFYALSLSILGMYCGIKLADHSEKGKRYLVYYLIPQIPFVSIPGLIYYFKYGASFTAYMVLPEDMSSIDAVLFNSSIGSYFNLNSNLDASLGQVLLGINILPVAMLLFLYKAHRNDSKQKLELETQREEAKKARASKKENDSV